MCIAIVALLTALDVIAFNFMKEINIVKISINWKRKICAFFTKFNFIIRNY